MPVPNRVITTYDGRWRQQQARFSQARLRSNTYRWVSCQLQLLNGMNIDAAAFGKARPVMMALLAPVDA